MNVRCAGPNLPHRLSRPDPTRRHLGQGFHPALADCRYRAPLPPRLARPNSVDKKWRREWDLNPRGREHLPTRSPGERLRPDSAISPHTIVKPVKTNYGGESGIRTHEARQYLLAFEASAFNRTRPSLPDFNLSLFVIPPLFKKFLKQLATVSAQHTGGNLKAVIEPLVVGQPV